LRARCHALLSARACALRYIPPFSLPAEQLHSAGAAGGERLPPTGALLLCMRGIAVQVGGSARLVTRVRSCPTHADIIMHGKMSSVRPFHFARIAC